MKKGALDASYKRFRTSKFIHVTFEVKQFRKIQTETDVFEVDVGYGWEFNFGRWQTAKRVY